MSSWIDIAKCAEELTVSSATIRNWIKAGHLISDGKSRVSRESIERAKRELIGAVKLTSRANKLYKTDSHKGEYHESRRNRDGIYYTPQNIVEDMLSSIDLSEVDLARATLLDPCCGSGNFLIGALQLGFRPENIYGYDLDPNAVEIAKNRIEELTKYKSKQIICRDFLEVEIDRKYDFIFTNPPWGKKLMGKFEGRKIDSSELFFRTAINHLIDNGYIGFLMQDAVFNIGRYSSFREFMLRYNILKLSHYGKQFKGLMCAAQAVIIQNKSNQSDTILCDNGESCYHRRPESFALNCHTIFNFRVKPEYAELITTLLKSNNYTTLKNSARWGLGIVTGDNKRFCSREPRDGYRPIFRGEDISSDGLAKPSLYITSDLSDCQQVAPLELYNSPSKIIYKFISSKLRFHLDRDQQLILNSANMLLLDSSFPLTEQQLVALLNSDFMNWLYNSIFAAHKVLRRDLEQLPIFTEYFANNKEFNETEYLHHIGIERDNLGGYQIIIK